LHLNLHQLSVSRATNFANPIIVTPIKSIGNTQYRC